MRALKHIVLSVFVLIFLTSISYAEKLQEPKVEYSADSYMEFEQGVMKGKVFHAPGKERREQDASGMKQVIITRMDKKVVWILMPEDKSYMEQPIKEAMEKQHDPMEYDYEYTVIGPEKVNGMDTTKSRITAKTRNGMVFEGFMWATKDGILVKMDATAKDKNSRNRVKTELKNIKIGKVDASLFEVPSNYSKFGFGGMGGFNMQEMMKGMKGLMPNQGDEGSEE